MENNVIYDAIQSVAEQTEYNGGGIEALLNGRIVKTIQSGVLKQSTSTGQLVEISITTVDLQKSVLICLPLAVNMVTREATGVPVTVTLKSDKIEIQRSNDEHGGWYRNMYLYFSWQVIEFY